MAALSPCSWSIADSIQVHTLIALSESNANAWQTSDGKMIEHVIVPICTRHTLLQFQESLLFELPRITAARRFQESSTTKAFEAMIPAPA